MPNEIQMPKCQRVFFSYLDFGLDLKFELNNLSFFAEEAIFR
jgi:hypothetical protein